MVNHQFSMQAETAAAPHAPTGLAQTRIGIRELNQATSEVINRVRQGETILVTDRGIPVAHLVPVQRGEAVLDRLVAAGRARSPRVAQGPVPMPPVLGDPTVDVAAELAASREDERW